MNISRKAYDKLAATAASFQSLLNEKDNLRKAYEQVSAQSGLHITALNDELKIVVTRLENAEASNQQLSQEYARLLETSKGLVLEKDKMAEANRKLVELLAYAVDNYNRLAAEQTR